MAIVRKVRLLEPAMRRQVIGIDRCGQGHHLLTFPRKCLALSTARRRHLVLLPEAPSSWRGCLGFDVLSRSRVSQQTAGCQVQIPTAQRTDVQWQDCHRAPETACASPRRRLNRVKPVQSGLLVCRTAHHHYQSPARSFRCLSVFIGRRYAVTDSRRMADTWRPHRASQAKPADARWRKACVMVILSNEAGAVYRDAEIAARRHHAPQAWWRMTALAVSPPYREYPR